MKCGVCGTLIPGAIKTCPKCGSYRIIIYSEPEIKKYIDKFKYTRHLPQILFIVRTVLWALLCFLSYTDNVNHPIMARLLSPSMIVVCVINLYLVYKKRDSILFLSIFDMLAIIFSLLLYDHRVMYLLIIPILSLVLYASAVLIQKKIQYDMSNISRTASQKSFVREIARYIPYCLIVICIMGFALYPRGGGKSSTQQISATTNILSSYTVILSSPTPSPSLEPTPEIKEIKVEFLGKIEPTTVRVGKKLVLELTLSNLSDTTVEDYYVYGDGDWDKFTIAGVTPGGQFEKSWFSGCNFYTAMDIPPGEKRVISIILYPNEAGNYDFSFIPHSADESCVLRDEKGDSIVIGGPVAVIK